jgi:hypothetical protein
VDNISGIIIIGVCFRTWHPQKAPFLRPMQVESEMLLDPVCCLPDPGYIYFYDGVTILQTSPSIHVSVETGATSEIVPYMSELEMDETTTIVITGKGDGDAGGVDAIRQVNRVAPTRGGDMSISSLGGHLIHAVLDESDVSGISIQPGKLYIGSISKPCCDCEDYADEYNRLKELYAKVATIVTKYNEAAAALQDSAAKIKASIKPSVAINFIYRLASEKAEKSQFSFDLTYANPSKDEVDAPPVLLEVLYRDGTAVPITTVTFRDAANVLSYQYAEKGLLFGRHKISAGTSKEVFYVTIDCPYMEDAELYGVKISVQEIE